MVGERADASGGRTSLRIRVGVDHRPAHDAQDDQDAFPRRVWHLAALSFFFSIYKVGKNTRAFVNAQPYAYTDL
jgi:hypothetical protein